MTRFSLFLCLVVLVFCLGHVQSTSSTNLLCTMTQTSEMLTLVFLLFILFLSVMCTFFLIKKNFHFLPESVATIAIGVIIGLIVRVLPNNMSVYVRLDPDVFFVVFLPTIIFEAGYNLEKGDFFGNLGGIIVYAVFGTILSTIVVSVGIFVLGYYGLSRDLSVIDCLMYGSLISAVDPVATLAIFNSMKVNPTLHYLVFGESVVNDAVAIVLFKTFEQLKEGQSRTWHVTGGTVAQAIGQFFYISFGSVAFGIAFALISALFFKYVDMRKNTNLELGVFFIFAYLPYFLSTPFLSGIMCVLTCGIFMNYYTRINLSLKSQNTISEVVRAFAFLCETCVFLYLGMAIFNFSNFKVSVPLVAWSLLLCLVGRFANIVPLTYILNCYRTHKITIRNQVIMWFSGLRGAIAFALALGMRDSDEDGEYIFSTTLIISILTIFLFGGGTYPMLKLLKIERRVENSESSMDLRSIEEKSNFLTRLDRKYFQRWLIRKDAEVDISDLQHAEDTKKHSHKEDVVNGEVELTATVADAGGTDLNRSLSILSIDGFSDDRHLNTSNEHTDEVTQILEFIKAQPGRAVAVREALNLYDN